MKPPEKFVAFNGVVYEIIPGSEDFPETETEFGGPHYTRNGLGRWASPDKAYDLEEVLLFIGHGLPSRVWARFRELGVSELTATRQI